VENRSDPLKRAKVVFSAGLAVLLIGGCGGCPSTTPSGAVISVSPASAAIVAGRQQVFIANGAPGPFTWTLPNGGGEIQPNATGISATVTAGTVVGTYRVRATFSTATAEAQFQVIAGGTDRRD
jgi:hypothetical protein